MFPAVSGVALFEERSMRSAANKDEAFKLAITTASKSHGFLQWKASKVFMTVHCKCGHRGQVEGDFIYHVRCPRCGAVYACNPFVELIRLDETPDSCVVDLE